jgi:hypothetical protein
MQKIKKAVNKNKKSENKTKPPPKKPSNALTLNEKKGILKRAIFSAIEAAFTEKTITTNQFKEEALRYIVMAKIAEVKIWGKFPNSKTISERIVFEHKYNTSKNKNSNERYPDISSYSMFGKKITKYNLAIELKISTGKEKGINYDKEKLKHYVAPNKGEISYEMGALVVMPSKNKTKCLQELDKIKEKYNKQKLINTRKANILICWMNTNTNKIDCFWLEVK